MHGKAPDPPRWPFCPSSATALFMGVVVSSRSLRNSAEPTFWRDVKLDVKRSTDRQGKPPRSGRMDLLLVASDVGAFGHAGLVGGCGWMVGIGFCDSLSAGQYYRKISNLAFLPLIDGFRKWERQIRKSDPPLVSPIFGWEFT